MKKLLYSECIFLMCAGCPRPWWLDPCSTLCAVRGCRYQLPGQNPPSPRWVRLENWSAHLDCSRPQKNVPLHCPSVLTSVESVCSDYDWEEKARAGLQICQRKRNHLWIAAEHLQQRVFQLQQRAFPPQPRPAALYLYHLPLVLGVGGHSRMSGSSCAPFAPEMRRRVSSINSPKYCAPLLCFLQSCQCIPVYARQIWSNGSKFLNCRVDSSNDAPWCYGHRITVPPSVSVPDVLGAQAVWISWTKKTKKWCGGFFRLSVFCLFLFCLYICVLRISSNLRSIASVLLDSAGRFQATLLLHTTCMCSWGNWIASCVAALQTKYQKPLIKRIHVNKWMRNQICIYAYIHIHIQWT